METFNLIATTRIGLETVVRLELQALGYQECRVANSQVAFQAAPADIPRANLWLRCAERVLLQMGEFSALTFEELYEKTNALPWESLIPPDGAFPVSGNAVKSTLGSVRACQSIVKKAIVDRLLEAHGVADLPESGPLFAVKVALFKDVALLTVDTSGDGLHKRGYRATAGEAPLKETLAAALVRLSFWNKERLLLDPLCGSGTILIEAALLGRNIAPGLRRRFAAEGWPLVPEMLWQTARSAAEGAIDHDTPLQLQGYDREETAIAISKQNAALAGVGDDIRFAVKPLEKLWIDRQYGIVITNPPYGRRLAEFRDINQLYITFNQMFRKKSGWSIYVLTADEKFPDYFKRDRPSRVRKLYNGNIQAYYYQYYGERPPHSDA